MTKQTKTNEALKAAGSALEDAIERQTLMESQHYQDISEIVHDIKNPLSAMIGYIQLINNEAAGPLGNDTYKGYALTLDRSANRLLGICNSLLGEYSEHEKDRIEQKEQVVDVTALLGEIRDLFAAQAKERGIKLESTIENDFPDIVGDPQDMYRAIMNLVSNALKFTPEGGRVTIQAEIDKSENAFIMVVRDSGIGMTREQIEKVLDDPTSTVSPHGDIGTGHGLAIVNRIVGELGGKLNIVSTENQGTRVKIIFAKDKVRQSQNMLLPNSLSFPA
ncbi:MAG: HAMP domain-containing histidine kinase [Rhodospirillaceae bacterium]|nr:HAMP domain-containing histidine kinase [Rhodospirillaceae bacterium]